MLSNHGIYIQPMRITPGPYHGGGLIDNLAESLIDVWQEFGLPLNERALAAE